MPTYDRTLEKYLREHFAVEDDVLIAIRENIQPGGIVAGHNAFGHGDVVNAADISERTEALRGFNRRLAEDPRMVSMIFPAGDGTAFAVRRK
jgi:predicted O-methyltransferase YrrM